MSFHPKMAYGATFHKSARQLEDEGAAVRLHAGEPRAVRRDRHALSARSPPLGGAAGAVSRAAPAGLHHRERDAPRRRAARHHAAPTSRTSCRTTRCSTRRPVGKFVLQRLPDAVVRAERRRARHRGDLRQALGIKPGETDATGTFTLLEVECLGACDRAPVDHGQRRLARVPDARRTSARLVDDLRARGEAALTGCHHVVERSSDDAQPGTKSMTDPP